MRKYNYKSKYHEKNSKTKERKCSKCDKMYKNKDLESRDCCRFCYIKEKGMKRCSKCHLLKKTSEFYKSKSLLDGFYSSCKVCCKESRL